MFHYINKTINNNNNNLIKEKNKIQPNETVCGILILHVKLESI